MKLNIFFKLKFLSLIINILTSIINLVYYFVLHDTKLIIYLCIIKLKKAFAGPKKYFNEHQS